MKIYTKTGDDGTTGLFGGGRLPKPHPRIEAYGTVDETNSFLGVSRSHIGNREALAPLDDIAAQIQRDLFVLGADLATPLDAKATVPRIEDTHVARLENWIDALQDTLPPLKHFILPGGSEAAAALHVARAICRRAERSVVALMEQEALSPTAAMYLNRLSDLLFTMARYANNQLGIDESAWNAS